ncbi:MAG: hypothetical protein HOL45_12420 [Chloroflexi bacterium]|nr:hypothetical protein [Chloroflexota bacterium]
MNKVKQIGTLEALLTPTGKAIFVKLERRIGVTIVVVIRERTSAPSLCIEFDTIAV